MSQNKTPTYGDVLLGQEIIYSPSRKMHPFALIPVPQLLLSLVLVAINFSYGKKRICKFVQYHALTIDMG